MATRVLWHFATMGVVTSRESRGEATRVTTGPVGTRVGLMAAFNWLDVNNTTYRQYCDELLSILAD